MSKYKVQERKRNQTLLIVEGNHEKNELFWLIFKCFPEVDIDLNNVWIYGTNIYMLYEDIVNMYGHDWVEEEIDVDLPFVISKKKTPDNVRYKNDFTKILLVFDYERHDTNFSEEKITQMQRKFFDVTDMGQLYINYPMIESYQHLVSIPDLNYEGRKVPVSLQPGSKYKELVRKESIIQKIVEFPHRLDDLLKKHYGIDDKEIRQKCCDSVLTLTDRDCIEESLEKILQNIIPYDKAKTLKFQLKDWINKAEYANTKKTYWQYMRNLFVEIIYHNICKANLILRNTYNIQPEQYKECFEGIDLVTILEKQNASSSSIDSGYIWVLNTCIFVVADYNFALLQKENNL